MTKIIYFGSIVKLQYLILTKIPYINNFMVKNKEDSSVVILEAIFGIDFSK